MASMYENSIPVNVLACRFAANCNLSALVIALTIDAMQSDEPAKLIDSHYDVASAFIESQVHDHFSVAMQIEAIIKYFNNQARYIDYADNGIDGVYYVTVQTLEEICVIVNDANQVIDVQW